MLKGQSGASFETLKEDRVCAQIEVAATPSGDNPHADWKAESINHGLPIMHRLFLCIRIGLPFEQEGG